MAWRSKELGLGPGDPRAREFRSRRKAQAFGTWGHALFASPHAQCALRTTCVARLGRIPAGAMPASGI
jgi:hypothetical protein